MLHPPLPNLQNIGGEDKKETVINFTVPILHLEYDDIKKTLFAYKDRDLKK